VGFENPIVEISIQIKQLNEITFEIILGLLSFELIPKYLKIRNWKKFLKQYWLDIAMVVLIPMFAEIKVFKAITLAKKIKIVKY